MSLVAYNTKFAGGDEAEFEISYLDQDPNAPYTHFGVTVYYGPGYASGMPDDCLEIAAYPAPVVGVLKDRATIPTWKGRLFLGKTAGSTDAAAAGSAGDTTIQVTSSSGFNVGDTIVIAPKKSTVVWRRVTALLTTPTRLQLDEPLKYGVALNDPVIRWHSQFVPLRPGAAITERIVIKNLDSSSSRDSIIQVEGVGVAGEELQT